MDRLPCPAPVVPFHRRGSTPSLVQFATINAQIKKERVSPSLEIINYEDDEDRDIGSRSLSQPALNIVHVTNVKGQPNALSITPCFTASFKRNKLSSKKKTYEDKYATPGEETTMSLYLKRSSSHGMLGTNGEVDKTDSVIVANIPNINNRRNTWCHASGTSAVAIDNKIEQAMDLVKSHLMFAVREEVEVLKEKIAELMERINQLEAENSLLRSQASQETLAQLSIPPPATSPPSGSTS